MSLSAKSQQTLKALNARVGSDNARMPNIKAIHELLTEAGVKHSFYASTNIVTHKSVGNRYVNSRYEGKKGMKIEIADRGQFASLDTSSSYYSINGYGIARKLIEVIQALNQAQ